MGLQINFFQKWFLCPLFCVCSFITVGHSRRSTVSNLHKHHFSEMSVNTCFHFWLLGPSLWAIVDFPVPEVLNSNNLLSEAVFGLKLFYPISFWKQFCVFFKTPEFMYTSRPLNLRDIPSIIYRCLQAPKNLSFG